MGLERRKELLYTAKITLEVKVSVLRFRYFRERPSDTKVQAECVE